MFDPSRRSGRYPASSRPRGARCARLGPSGLGAAPLRGGILALLVCVLAATAHASPLFELAGDPGPGGLTARENADGPAAAYFNPALLADQPPGFELGVFVLAEEIGITVDGRSTSPACGGGACDVPAVDDRGPESFRDSGTGEAIASPTVPTDWLQHGHGSFGARPRQAAGSGHKPRAYQTVGLIAPVFRNRLVLGLFAMIPLGEFTTAKAFYNDEREQFFSNSLHPELYGDRLTATSLAFGGGLHLTRDLRVGVTFTLSLANHAAAPVYVSNLNDLSTVDLDSNIAVNAAVAPHFGLAWTPTSRALVSATVHTPSSFKIDTGFDYTLATGTEQATELHFTHSYLPLQIAVGGTYQLGDASPWSVTGEVKYARWSRYHDRHDDTPGGDYAWSDTATVTGGARWRAGGTRAWLDGTYVPTPVPAQTGRTNYVDNDRIGIAAGMEHVLVGWGSRFRVGADLLGQRLLARHVTKFVPPAGAPGSIDPQYVQDEVPDDAIDVLGQPVPGRTGLQTNNPGFPGFASSGWILGAGVHVAIEY